MQRRTVLAAAAGLAASPLLGHPAFAQAAARTLRFVPSAALTSIDPMWSLATSPLWFAYRQPTRHRCGKNAMLRSNKFARLLADRSR